MRIHRLAESSGTGATVPEVAALIDHIGRPVFAASLFKSTFGWVRADHLTAFVFEPGCAPRTIFAENAGTVPVAREVAELYCRDYWRHDLANQTLHASSETDEIRTCAVHTAASEIAHTEYRRCCYTAISLDSRVSLSEQRDGQTIRINFYRTRNNAFSNADVEQIIDSAHLLLALVRRHAAHISPKTSLEHYYERLCIVAPSLTRREAEVCAGIIGGLTSEGIALELGIRLNTVLTHKKRAYSRLEISSQNQLLRLILN